MSHFSIGISGMTCASCVSRIETALQAVSGVQHASVNLVTERATIQIIKGLPIATLIEAIQQAGSGTDSYARYADWAG